LARSGFRVAITGRRADLLTSLAATNPQAFIVSVFDITELAEIPGRLDNLVQQLGGLDLFFISAGGGDLNDSLDFAVDKKMIDLNVSAFTAQAGWAFNFFHHQGHGQLAAISSIAGIRGLRHSPGYNACKAYQINYLEGLRQKATHLKLPIYITDIRPGFVDTPAAKGEGRFWQSTVQKQVPRSPAPSFKKNKSPISPSVGG
jgi:NADP-dependent 3-hydroxy acid dehydrogenase YdfG